MSLKNKLNRMKKHIVREEDKVEQTVTMPADSGVTIPDYEKWKQHGVKAYYFDDDYCLIKEKRYPLGTKHGNYKFKDLIDAVVGWQTFCGEHPLSSKGLGHEDLFFFDTETTGLGGGAGNTIFLLGYAKVERDEVILRQHLLPQPGSEIPLYNSFLEKVDYTTLVTYNGKAFDWPQVKTRHTLIKEHVPMLPSFGHFDLFHGSRRLFKHRIDRVKLTNVEKEVLGFHRVDDVPGYLAPMIYFDFVERKDPEALLKVMEHNELDILSLITLYTHLSKQILGEEKDVSSEESYAVGKWLEYTGNDTLAKEQYKKVINASEKVNYEAVHALAYQYKKEKNFKKASELWSEIVDTAPYTIKKEALIELAKIYEHKNKEYQKALEMCDEAISLYSRYLTSERKEDSFLKDINHRKERVQRKLANTD
ncbi:ribonuclease H-like domain-containing protein [Bacillus seohaeanensis]|uniref:Ribonuclease H-like domain-containing protein n=1 Tax=Bacillus seohaeanensis TaxID=284580 RepID=A0ABW5RSK5_9BACI